VASTHIYYWQATDSDVSVAGRYLLLSGYASLSAFLDALRQQNPTIYDWGAIPVNTPISIPYATS